jgi:hypothetical protein
MVKSYLKDLLMTGDSTAPCSQQRQLAPLLLDRERRVMTRARTKERWHCWTGLHLVTLKYCEKDTNEWEIAVCRVNLTRTIIQDDRPDCKLHTSSHVDYDFYWPTCGYHNDALPQTFIKFMWEFRFNPWQEKCAPLKRCVVWQQTSRKARFRCSMHKRKSTNDTVITPQVMNLATEIKQYARNF